MLAGRFGFASRRGMAPFQILTVAIRTIEELTAAAEQEARKPRGVAADDPSGVWARLRPRPTC
jgi:hypothetical protein